MTREEAIANLTKLYVRIDITDDYEQALDMAISSLSAEGEYIKKEDALAELNKWDWQELYLPIHFKENILDVLPTYSFPDREKGEWIDISTGKGIFKDRSVKCSNCRNTLNLNGVNCGRGDANFCPNCGADMRGDKAE